MPNPRYNRRPPRSAHPDSRTSHRNQSSASRSMQHQRPLGYQNGERVSKHARPDNGVRTVARAQRGKTPAHIDNVAPTAEARARSHVRGKAERIGKGSLAKAELHRSQRRRRIVVALCVIAALVLACAAGVYVYFKTTDRNLGLTSSNASDALVAPVDGEPYYVLCTADLALPDRLPPSSDDLAIMLVRVDEQAKALTFVSIPSSLSLTFSDGEKRAVGDYPAELGDAGLIEAIANFADVPIAHYVTTDAQHLKDMVNNVGPIDMELATEIDDPSAGIIVLDAGTVELGPEEAIVLLRAQNIPGGYEGTAHNRVAFTVQLLNQALDTSGLGLATTVSDASGYISTDWSASSLLAAGEALKPFSSITVQQCVVPYSATTSVNDWSRELICNTAEWEIVMDAVRSGGNVEEALSGGSVEALRDCSVEIRNGAALDGAGAALSSKLESAGYRIGEVGNTYDGIVYPDTLVIYTKPENEDYAKRVMSDIGQGRLVNGGDFYSTASDVLVIIGADWVS